MVEAANLKTMVDAYIECALWSTNDESTPQGGAPLDENYSVEDVAPETIKEMQEDCAKFALTHFEAIETWPGASNRNPDPYGAAGHDLWLNRNGHGAGFWDGDWPEPAATELSDAARAFGNVDLYVGDDGLIRQM